MLTSLQSPLELRSKGMDQEIRRRDRPRESRERSQEEGPAGGEEKEARRRKQEKARRREQEEARGGEPEAGRRIGQARRTNHKTRRAERREQREDVISRGTYRRRATARDFGSRASAAETRRRHILILPFSTTSSRTNKPLTPPQQIYPSPILAFGSSQSEAFTPANYLPSSIRAALFKKAHLMRRGSPLGLSIMA